MLLPTKAVPYLYMGNFEKRGALFHEHPETMAKWSDVFLGVLSVILDRSEATKRAFREGYLKPGLYESIVEPDKCGCTFQYHSLSSYWTRCPELISLVTAHMRIAARLSLAEYEGHKAINAFWEKTDHDEIADIIQSYDFERALDMYNKLKPCIIHASVRATDPMSSRAGRLDCIEYVMRKGIDNIWSSTNIIKNFKGQNGWFTGMNQQDSTIKAFFSSGNPLPTLDSIIMPENIEFLNKVEESIPKDTTFDI